MPAREERPSVTDFNVAQFFLAADPARFRYAYCDANLKILVDACYQAEKPVTVFQLGRIFNQVEHMLIPSSSYTAAYRNFFEKNPVFSNSDANRNLLDSAFVSKGLNRELGLEDLEKILPHIQGLSVTPEAIQADSKARERKQIIKECVARLIDADGKPKLSLCRGNLSPQTAHRQEVERINGLSLDELRLIKQKRETAQALQNLPVDELRKKVREDFQTTHPPHGRFLPLPEKFIPFGKGEGCGVFWSRNLIMRLDPRTLRVLNERYGVEAINQILNGSN